MKQRRGLFVDFYNPWSTFDFSFTPHSFSPTHHFALREMSGGTYMYNCTISLSINLTLVTVSCWNMHALFLKCIDIYTCTIYLDKTKLQSKNVTPAEHSYSENVSNVTLKYFQKASFLLRVISQMKISLAWNEFCGNFKSDMSLSRFCRELFWRFWRKTLCQNLSFVRAATWRAL